MRHGAILGACIAALSCAMLPGCISLYSTRPVEVVVTKAGSGEPAGGVPVEVRYVYMLVLNAPERAEGMTDTGGSVTLPIADFRDGIIVLKIGDSEYGLVAATVRQGGALPASELTPYASADTPYRVRLTPKRRPLTQLFGSDDRGR
jgi:hypothetical protein